jgi:hypothetical protein
LNRLHFSHDDEETDMALTGKGKRHVCAVRTQGESVPTVSGSSGQGIKCSESMFRCDGFVRAALSTEDFILESARCATRLANSIALLRVLVSREA